MSRRTKSVSTLRVTVLNHLRALDPILAGEGGAPAASLRPDGALRILPHHRAGGTDGFYIARMRKAR